MSQPENEFIDRVCDQFRSAWEQSENVPDMRSYIEDCPAELRQQLLDRLMQINVPQRQQRDLEATIDRYGNLDPEATRLAEDIQGSSTGGSADTPTSLPSNEFADATLERDGRVDATPLTSSSMIGPYKLLQTIGEGGMGTVWMAEQTKPVRRRVALKLVKDQISSKEIVGRFEAEQQALAIMDHNNICKVLDAGTTETGNPYFVMELVMGIPITQYCDENKLDINERLRLFVPVCRAVQHAHQKGILHRDLKPSNVLVTIYEGNPIPKVIDFGLAKAIDHTQKLTDKTIFTEFGKVVGTIQYMSPEQAGTNALNIDSRTDVYSLGVMLYELLTGSTPIQRSDIGQNQLIQVLAMIREREPQKPSERLSSSQHELDAIGRYRSVSTGRLLTMLRGELDWVVMTALENDRSQRYASAKQLAEDIERFLQNEPVQARPPSTFYRLKKSVLNNKGKYASVALTSLAMLIAIFFGWRALKSAGAERQRVHAFEMIGSEGWVDRLPEIESTVKSIESRETQSELRILLRTKCQERITQRLSQADWVEQWPQINQLLELAEPEFQESAADRVAVQARNLVQRRLESAQWNESFDPYQKTLATISSVDNQTATAALIHQACVQRVIQGMDETQYSKTIDLLQQQQRSLANNSLADDVERVKFIHQNAGQMFEHLDELRSRLNNIENKDFREYSLQLVSSNLETAAINDLNLHGADDFESARQQLKDKLKIASDYFSFGDQVESVLDNPAIFPTLVKVDINAALTKAGCVSQEDAEQTWWMPPQRPGGNGALLMLTEQAGWESEFKSEFKIPTGLLQIRFVRKKQPRLALTIAIERTNDQGLCASVYRSNQLVRTSYLKLPKNQSNILIHWNNDRFRIEIGDQSFDHLRLFVENMAMTRMQVVGSPDTAISNVQFSRSIENEPPAEYQMDEQFITGDQKAAVAHYRDQNDATASEMTKVKHLVALFRQSQGKNDSARQQLEAIGNRQVNPMSGIATFELMADKIRKGKLDECNLYFGRLFSSADVNQNQEQVGQRNPLNGDWRDRQYQFLASYGTVFFWDQFYGRLDKSNEPFQQMTQRRQSLDLFESFTDRMKPFTPAPIRTSNAIRLSNAYSIHDDEEKSKQMLWQTFRSFGGQLPKRSELNLIDLLVDACIYDGSQQELQELTRIVRSRIESDSINSSSYQLQLAQLLTKTGTEESLAQAKKVVQSLVQSKDSTTLALALLMQGFFEQADGNDEAAKKNWEQAFDHLWKSESAQASLQFMIAASLSGRFTKEHFRANLEKNFSGQHVVQISILRAAISGKLEEILVSVLRDAFTDEFGNDLAKRFVFGEITNKQMLYEPHVNAIRAVCKKMVFDSMTKNQTDVCVNMSRDAMELWREGEMKNHVFAGILFSFYEGNQMQSTLDSLPNPIRHRLAYIFAHRQLRLEKPEAAKEMFEYASKTKDESLREMIQSDLRSLK